MQILPLIAIVSTSVISPTMSTFIRRHYVGHISKIQQTSNARGEPPGYSVVSIRSAPVPGSARYDRMDTLSRAVLTCL